MVLARYPTADAHEHGYHNAYANENPDALKDVDAIQDSHPTHSHQNADKDAYANTDEHFCRNNATANIAAGRYKHADGHRGVLFRLLNKINDVRMRGPVYRGRGAFGDACFYQSRDIQSQ